MHASIVPVLGVACDACIYKELLDLLILCLSIPTQFRFAQSCNNGAVGIAQNKCSGNYIQGNIVYSNEMEGITADNQSQGGQVFAHAPRTMYRN